MTFLLVVLAVARILIEFVPVLRPLRLKMNSVTPVSHELHRWGLVFAIGYLLTLI